MWIVAVTKDSEMASHNEELFVVAIDIGTTFTGCAYSTKNDYKHDPLTIYSNAPWVRNKHRPDKAPTVVLLDSDDLFHSFGYEAQDKYAELVEEGEHYEWRYFTGMKMKLYSESGNKVSRDLIIEDKEGRPFIAMKLFQFVIQYLKDNFLEQVKNAFQGVELSDIKWVITVPAIWDDISKQFMREAAIKAGIPAKHLIIALEPECAAVYCKNVQMRRTQKEGKTSLNAFDPGAKFLLIDLGGGTVDITVQEVVNDEKGSLKQLYKASGGAWGGQNVNNAFHKFLEDIFSKDAYSELARTQRSDYLDLERGFETKKKGLKNSSGTYREFVQITLPMSLLEIYKTQGTTDSLKSKLEGKAEFLNPNKLRIKMDFLKTLFNGTLSNFVDHLSGLLKNKDVCQIENVLLVGGFSESPLVQDQIKLLFEDKTIPVIVPAQSGTATLEGAVLFGHDQSSVSSRKSRYSYGIESHGIFNKNIHPKEKKFRDGGTKWCKDMFGIFVKANETVIPGKTKIKRIFSVDKTASELPITIYYTEKDTPLFVDEDGCQRLGECILDMSEDKGEENRSVRVSMSFGKTEIEISAKNMKTKTRVKTKVDFL